MSIYSLQGNESRDAAHLTASIERCAARSAEVNGISLEDFTERMHTAVEYLVAQQEDPVVAWHDQSTRRFPVSEALGHVGLVEKRYCAVPPLVRLLHNRIRVMEKLGEYNGKDF
jgi:hypothetical protein